MKIAVAGATGRVGRHLVDELRNRGHKVAAMSRLTGVDVTTGEGLDRCLEGAECVIDASSSSSPEQKAATEFFTTSARNLHAAGKKAGVKRMIVISIIGIDKFTAGYMAAKIAHEKAVTAGPIPVQILRAAQFHELVSQMMEWGQQGDVSYLPRMKTQLVAAQTVAEKLAEMAEDAAGSGTLEIAGPKPEDLVEAAKRLVARRGDKVRIEVANNEADPDRKLYESGALLAGPKTIIAGPTFDEWLQSTYRKAA